MSVALLLTHKDDRRTMLPVATEEVFERYWVPSSEQLGLEYVPLFQTGVRVTRDDLPLISQELDQLRAHFAAAYRDEVGEGLLQRVDLLAGALAELQLARETPDIYIG